MSSSVPVSLHPYFRVNPGQMEEVKKLLPEFVKATTTEPGVLFYEFTLCGDLVFCREAYPDAAATLAHLSNVGPLLERMLVHSKVDRLEVHGPAGELEKLKETLGPLNPSWFAYQCGLQH